MQKNKLIFVTVLLTFLFMLVGCGSNLRTGVIEGTAYIDYTFDRTTYAPVGSDVYVFAIKPDGSRDIETTSKIGQNGSFTVSNLPDDKKLLVSVRADAGSGVLVDFSAPTVITNEQATVEVTPSSTMLYDILADRAFGYLGNTSSTWASDLSNRDFMSIFTSGLQVIEDNLIDRPELKNQLLTDPPEDWFLAGGFAAYFDVKTVYESLVYEENYDSLILDTREDLISETTLENDEYINLDGLSGDWYRDMLLQNDPTDDFSEYVSNTIIPLDTYNVGYDLVSSYGARAADKYYFAIKMDDRFKELHDDGDAACQMVIEMQFGDTNQMCKEVIDVTATYDVYGETVTVKYLKNGEMVTTYNDDVEVVFDPNHRFVEFSIEKAILDLIAYDDTVYMFVESFLEQDDTVNQQTSVETTIDTMFFKKINLH